MLGVAEVSSIRIPEDLQITAMKLIGEEKVEQDEGQEDDMCCIGVLGPARRSRTEFSVQS